MAPSSHAWPGSATRRCRCCITGYAELDDLDVSDSVIVQKPFRDDELATKLSAALKRHVA